MINFTFELDPNGNGPLVDEFIRVLNMIQENQPDHHVFYVFENVASMPIPVRDAINK